MPCRNSEEEEV